MTSIIASLPQLLVSADELQACFQCFAACLVGACLAECVASVAVKDAGSSKQSCKYEPCAADLGSSSTGDGRIGLARNVQTFNVEQSYNFDRDFAPLGFKRSG